MAALSTDNRTNVAPDSGVEVQNLAELQTTEVAADFSSEYMLHDNSSSFDGAFSQFSHIPETNPEQTSLTLPEQVQSNDLSPVEARELLKKHINEQQSELERQSKIAESNRRGSELNIENLKQQREELGIINRMAGNGAAIDKEIEATQKLRAGLLDKEIGIKRIAGDIRMDMESIAELENQAEELKAQGKIEEAQELYTQVDEALIAATERLSARVPGTTDALKAYRESLKEVAADHQFSSTVLAVGEGTARVAQGVTIAAGAAAAATAAAAAAPVVALGAGAVYVAGGLAGLATGATIGAAASYTEAEGHIRLGNKSEDQAYADAWSQTMDHAKTSAFAGFLAPAAAALNARIVGKIVADTSTKTGSAIAGAIESGTSSGLETVADTGIKLASGQAMSGTSTLVGIVADSVFGSTGKVLKGALKEVADDAGSAMQKAATKLFQQSADVALNTTKSAAKAAIDEKKEVDVTQSVSNRVAQNTTSKLIDALKKGLIS